MTIWTKNAVDVFAPTDLAGNARGPDNGEAQVWGTEVQRMFELALTSGLVYATQADLYADLVPGANAPGLVLNDPDPTKNGIYRKNGATTTGSWTRLADVPGYNVVRFSNVGAGTANAIEATAGGAVSTVAGAQIYTLNITANNTGNVTLNSRALLTSSGNQIAANGLVTGMNVAFLDDGTSYRLLSDQASAAVMAAVEAMVAEAEGYRDEAEDARDVAVASAVLAATYDPTVRFPSVPAMLASAKTAVGDGTVWQGGKWLYEEVSSGEHVTTAGGVKLRILDPVPSVEAFGVVGGATTIYPNVTISSGGTTLQISTSSFPASIVGQVIMINGAGAAGVPLVTTVASRTSATVVVIADAASTALSAVRQNVTFGIDESALFQACAAAFLKWTIPPGAYIASNIALRDYAFVAGAGKDASQFYRIADEPVFRTLRNTTSFTSYIILGGVGAFGRADTDTARVFDMRGARYINTFDLRWRGDPRATGLTSTSAMIGFDVSKGAAAWNGYIYGNDLWGAFCDIGFTAGGNIVKLTNGSLSANKTYGGKFVETSTLTIRGFDLSGNGYNTVASYVGTSPDGYYDKAGVLLDGCVGVDIKEGWFENNASMNSASPYSRSNVCVMSNCFRVFIDGNRWDPPNATNLDVLGSHLNEGIYTGSGLSPERHSFASMTKNGRFGRLLGSGAPADWTATGTITFEATTVLPANVGGMRLTASSGVPRLGQTIIPAADIPKYVGKTVTAVFCLVIDGTDWTGGHIRAGLSVDTAANISAGNSYFSNNTDATETAGRPIWVSVKRKIDGTEATGLHFVVQFYRTTGPWSVEIGDVSTVIGEVVPAAFEKPITTADPVLLGSHQTISTNVNFSLTPGTSPRSTLYTGTITAARTATLVTTNAIAGVTSWRITRTGGGLFQLILGSTGHALGQGEWAEIGFDGTAYFVMDRGRVSSPSQTIATDADVTLTPHANAPTVIHTGTLTADRAVTLATTNAVAGDRFTIKRTGGGAFNLNVGTGPLRAMAADQWATFEYDGSAWVLITAGAL